MTPSFGDYVKGEVVSLSASFLAGEPPEIDCGCNENNDPVLASLFTKTVWSGDVSSNSEGSPVLMVNSGGQKSVTVTVRYIWDCPWESSFDWDNAPSVSATGMFSVKDVQVYSESLVVHEAEAAKLKTVFVEGQPADFSVNLTSRPLGEGPINLAGTTLTFTIDGATGDAQVDDPYWYGSGSTRCDDDTNDYEISGSFTYAPLGKSANIDPFSIGAMRPRAFEVESPVMRPVLAGFAAIAGAPEPVPGIPSWFRCEISFSGFSRIGVKVPAIVGSSYGQYASMIDTEESYHRRQWESLDRHDGGSNDLGTRKGVMWWVNMVGEGPFYAYGETPEEASDNARDVILFAEEMEINTVWELWEQGRNFMEVRAKTVAGFEQHGAFLNIPCAGYDYADGARPPHPAYE